MADYDKFEVLEYLFNQKTANRTQRIGTDIDFTLREVGNAIMATRGRQPASWSNFVLDLTRKDSGITKRLPLNVINCGYDLRKKTGRVLGTSHESYCGTFIFRGKDASGHTIPLRDWLKLDEEEIQRTIIIDNLVPGLVREFLSNDEASLFSVIDHCDILSQVMEKQVYRIQSPMKLQPNEIDGFYVSQNGRIIEIYPVEAKAISTKDDINLVQILGQYKTLLQRYTHGGYTLVVRPVAIRMEKAGMRLAVLEYNPMYDPHRNPDAGMFNVREVIRIILNPPLDAWNQ